MIFFMVVDNEVIHEKVNNNQIDEQLFVRIGKNDCEALKELYLLTERAVYSFVLSILKNPHDTMDVVQETYLKIRASAHLYQPQGKPLAWMFTIARNLSNSFLRREGFIADNKILENDNTLQYSYINDPNDRMVLIAALNILQEQERQIILLHLVSGLKHREIAKDLNYPLSTVLSRYHRALKKLKKHLIETGAFK